MRGIIQGVSIRDFQGELRDAQSIPLT